MTPASSSLSSPPALSAAAARALPWTQRLPLSPLGTLFWLTLRQHARGRRLLVFAFLLVLPVVVVVLVRSLDPLVSAYQLQRALLPTLLPGPSVSFLGLLEVGSWLRRLHEFELALIFTLIPHVLVPLMALVYASSMIQDELEDQTLTYLLIRPSPKWVIYVAKLLATLFIALLLATSFTLLTYGAMSWGTPFFTGEVFWTHALKATALLALALVAYGSLFGCLSLLVRRSLVVGVAYIILFEGVLANIDFVVRRLTVMYYVRVLAERGLALNFREWSLDLTTAPSATSCLGILLALTLGTTFLAALVFTTREFRVKTPEGS